jgi:DedD protein
MAKQLSTDEESILKRKARRRLIGAIALTTAVVVILPMVLDREPAPSSQDIELRIPDKEHAGEFTPQVAMPAASAVIPGVQAGSAVAIAPLLDNKPVAVAARPKVETPAKPAAEAQPAAKPKVEAKPKSTAKPVEKTAVPHSGFVVQVGAFANAEGAKQLQAKLSRQGYHAYTEKSGNKTRVRVGGYTSHDAADKVKRKLEAQGLHPNVVNLN